MSHQSSDHHVQHPSGGQAPLSITALLKPEALNRFHRGEHHAIYELLGAHPVEVQMGDEVVQGTRFAVWAPNASRVAVVGDFNDWNPDADLLTPPPGHEASGVKVGFVPHAHPGQLYQYAMRGPDGEQLPYKADPVAFAAEVAPKRASRVCAPLNHVWSDQAWMQTRQAKHQLDRPVSIYELHLGSWSARGRLNYRDLAAELIPYVSALGISTCSLPSSLLMFRGRPAPLGPTWDGRGVNFALYSRHATASARDLIWLTARGGERALGEWSYSDGRYLCYALCGDAYSHTG